MNTRKILLSLVLVSMLIVSVSVASADTHFWKNIKTIKDYSIKDYFKDLRTPDPTPTPCIKTWFHKCPTIPTPIPIPIPTPVPTIIPTSVPTTVPTPTPIPTVIPTSVLTPEPTPIPMKGDISVSGSSATPTILTSETLMIIANIRSTFNTIIDTKLEVQVFASEGQPIPLFQSKQLLIGANSAETRIFEFSGLTEGTYQIRISSPVLDRETSKTPNEYSFNVKVLPKPTPTPTPTPSQDISVTATGPNTVNPPEVIAIVSTVNNTFSTSFNLKLKVTVTDAAPMSPTFQRQESTVTVPAYSTITKTLNFNTNGWSEGTHHIMVSIENKPGENANNNVYWFTINVPVKPKVKTIDLDLSRLDTVFQYSSIGDKVVGKGMYFWIDYTIVNRGEVTSTGDFTITSEGKTIFKGTSTLKAGETKKGRITLLSSQLPYRAEGYNYLLEGKISAPGDVNTKNDVMNVYVFVK